MTQVTPEAAPDVEVTSDGSIARVVPRTAEARDWIDENVQTEEWMWFGGALCVEPRYLDDLTAGMMDAGLLVAEG